MAIDRPDWQQGTDIEAQTIEQLNIDIIAQTLATLDVDLVAQTLGSLNVDIIAQTIGNIAINILQQAVGIFLQPEWSAKEGTDKDFDVVEVDMPWLGSASGNYTVPAGKTLYITDCSFMIRATYAADSDHPLPFFGYLYDETTGVYLARISGNVGVSKVFTKPGVVPENNVFTYVIYNASPISTSIAVHANGFEI